MPQICDMEQTALQERVLWSFTNPHDNQQTTKPAVLEGYSWSYVVFICLVLISEQTAISAAYNRNSLASLTEIESVYYAVRTGSLYKAVCASALNG
jgi:hypothetical protein